MNHLRFGSLLKPIVVTFAFPSLDSPGMLTPKSSSALQFVSRMIGFDHSKANEGRRNHQRCKAFAHTVVIYLANHQYQHGRFSQCDMLVLQVSFEISHHQHQMSPGSQIFVLLLGWLIMTTFCFYPLVLCRTTAGNGNPTHAGRRTSV